MTAEVNFLVGGEAGQGVRSVGMVLAKTMSRGGLHVFADQDYESRVRGGHNFFRIRVSDTEVRALDEKVDVLIALNEATIALHQPVVKEGGITIFDRDKVKVAGEVPAWLPIPLERLAVGTTARKPLRAC